MLIIIFSVLILLINPFKLKEKSVDMTNKARAKHEALIDFHEIKT